MWSIGALKVTGGNRYFLKCLEEFQCRLKSDKFYIRSSVHRNSRLKKSNKIYLYAHIYLLLNYSTFFGRPSRPSSEVHKAVVAASGTDLYQRLQLQFYMYA
jgi:hypothetical protein